MNRTTVALQGGRNDLPQLYNTSVGVAADEPEVRIAASSSPLLGTTLDSARHPEATTVHFGFAWDEAIALALRVLHIAKAARQALPEGVVLPDQILTLLASDNAAPPAPLAGVPPDLKFAVEAFPRVASDGSAVALVSTNGLGHLSEMVFAPDNARSVAGLLVTAADEADRVRGRTH